MGYRLAFPEVVADLASSANPAGPKGSVVPALVEDSHAAQAAVPHGQNHFARRCPRGAPSWVDLVVIATVGNLVCPAEFGQ